MPTNTKLNISSVIGIKDGIDQIFILINKHLDAYTQNTDENDQIEICQSYVRQLNGLLDMLELNDITIVSQQVEKLMGALMDESVTPKPAVIATLQHAVRELLSYLHELIAGAKEDPQRLFPAYRDIMQAQGIQNVTESTLFASRMVSEPSFQAALFNMAPAEISDLAKKTRSEYQLGFLQWLRDLTDKEGLQQMASAVSQVEKFPGSHQQRSFWWVCTGFMDHLLQVDTDIALSTRKLCGKIEQEIRRMADGKPYSPGQLLRDILDQVANSNADSERIREISHTYEWPKKLSAANDQENSSTAIDAQKNQQSILETMRKILELSFDEWHLFSSGEQQNLTPLSTHTEELKQLVTPLKCPPFEKLITAINDCVNHLRTHPQDLSEDLALEFAAALLLVQASLESFNQLSAEYPEQVETIATRLRLITTGEQDDTQLRDAPSLTVSVNQVQEKELNTQAADEMLSNLEKIEKILDRFFVNPTLRSELQKLSPLFKQIAGVLVMSDLERANTLLSLCHELMEKFSASSHEVTQLEQMLIANGLSSLGFFLKAIKSAQPEDHNIIEAAITQFDEAANAPTTTPPATDVDNADADIAANITPAEEIATEAATTEIDAELLSVFLEEADEVLLEVSLTLQICRKDSTQVDLLHAFKRSFHTLKGSGRMVKLHDLAEVAWNMEQVLDRWSNEKKPITSELIHLISHAFDNFSTWCINLNQYGISEIDATELQCLIDTLTQELTHEVDATSTIASRDEADANVAEHTPTPDKDNHSDVHIGDLTISLDLLEKFIAESFQQLDAIENDLNKLALQEEVSDNNHFMLTARTLSSNAQSLGLTFIAELASALEQWLILLQEDAIQPYKTSLECAQEIVTLLNIMLESIYNLQWPGASDILTGQTLAHELTLLHDQEEQSAEQITPPINIPTDQGLLSSPLLMPRSIPAEPEVYDERKDINPELWEVFFEEVQELTPAVAGKLRAWSILPQDNQIPKALLRALHTLKGGARMAGALHLGELMHQMESDIENITNEAIVSVPMIEKLKVGFDDINGRIDRIQNPRPVEENTQNQDDDTSIDKVLSVPEDEAAPGAINTEETSNTPTLKPSLRINAELIDQLVNESGEISIARSKVEAQLYSFKETMQDLNESVERLRGQLREVEIQAETQMQSQAQESDPTFDPLEFDRFTRFQELTRLMAESVDDIVTVQQSLRTIHGVAEEAVTEQAELNRQLQQKLIRIRTVPFDSITKHLCRVIQHTANDLNKKVDLVIQGAEIEIDRGVLEKINSPLEHVLRNAVAHGIELPDQRLALNKSEIGQVNIKLRQEGNEVVINISDDGSGLNTTRIREAAEHLGLIQLDETLDNDQLMALIFAHGLSTNKEVTEISGRGIGMDVVKNEISALGGRIKIQSATNQGTMFSIYLPLTLAVAQTVMIHAGEKVYAIPEVTVEHIDELGADALNAAYENHHVVYHEHNYPFAYLPHLLGEMEKTPEIKRHNQLLLLHSGTLRLAVHIDELLGNSEVVVKNIGPQLAQAPGVEGATIMGNGEIILIINPVKLLQRKEVQTLLTTPPASLTNLQKEMPKSDTIMVVDDSLTVRKITSRLLEREGYEVLIAKEGVSATKLLQDVVPDVMLVDLEMPQMNGFELIKNVRDNPKTKHTPIIIISSRTADKHRKMAKDLGVDVFLGKPYDEKNLLDHITKLLNCTDTTKQSKMLSSDT